MPSTPQSRAASRARRYTASSVDEVVTIPALLPPTPNPCASCPYRLDVPSGVWSAADYAKLPPFDLPTGEQPMGVFRCHQYDPKVAGPASHVCAGWAHTHARNPPGHELFSLRLAVTAGLLSITAARAVGNYSTATPCFTSGTAAAAHGIAELAAPGDAARAMQDKIAHRRPGTLGRGAERPRDQ